MRLINCEMCFNNCLQTLCYGGYSNRRGYYNDGSSYEYGGYSRRGGRRGGYSRDDGKKHMIEKLHGIMNEASDQKDKESIQRLIDQMNHEM